MYKIITEGKAKVKVPLKEKISKELPVFYNPVMEFNRTASILLLDSVENKNMKIALPLGGTGVRAARFLKELPKEKIKKICINDINKKASGLIRYNLKINKVSSRAKVSNKEANLFLTQSQGFDYIDIDPFGSPNTFLDAAVKHIGREGMLAVTATDTGCLAGAYPKACRRKYWAKPKKDHQMHETGLRILIRKVQLIGADHSKAFTPIFSYFKDHYFRVFFRCEKGKKKVDSILDQHGMFDDAGPLWLGPLWDRKIVSDMANDSGKEFLDTIAQESKIPVIGFYSIPHLCKNHSLEMTKQEKILKKIKNKGYKVALTHFSKNSIRSDIPEKELIKIFKKR